MKENLIDSIIGDVRAAEEEAQEIEKDAYQRGKTLVLDAEAEAEKQKRITVQECKEDKKRVLAEAEQRAEKERRDILLKGESAAKELAASKNSLVEEAADRIVNMLLAKY